MFDDRRFDKHFNRITIIAMVGSAVYILFVLALIAAVVGALIFFL